MENTVKAYCNNLPQLLNRRQFSKEELALFGFGEDFYEKRKKRSEQQFQFFLSKTFESNSTSLISPFTVIGLVPTIFSKISNTSVRLLEK